jgi:hypothetical protein
VHLEVRVDQFGDGAATCARRGLDGQFGGDSLRVLLRAPDGAALLGRAPELVTTGERPDFPDSGASLPDGCHPRALDRVGMRVGMNPEVRVRESLVRIKNQRMCTPEMLRAMTKRWISEVPSKIV